MNPERRDPTRYVTAIVVLVGVLAALVLGTAFGLGIGPFSDPGRSTVIATVDGRPIYLDDAVFRYQGLSATHGGGDQGLEANWREQVLRSLVDDQLIQIEAERLGLEVSDQEIANEVLRLQEMFPTTAEYEAWLASQGMDQAELERRIRLQTLGVRVYEEVTAGVKVSEQEIRSYYEEHTDEYIDANGEVAPYENVRAQIEETLRQQKAGEAYALWQARRREAVEVVVLDTEWWRSVEDEQQS